MILFLKLNEIYLYKCSNQFIRFHLKMESDEETATAVLLLVKKIEKDKKIRVGKTLAGEEN